MAYEKAIWDTLEGIKLALLDHNDLLKKNLELLNKIAEDKKSNPMESLLSTITKLKAAKNLKDAQDKEKNESLVKESKNESAG